jgi:hypothetical protein
VNEPARRPDLREQIGTAVNASSLAMRDEAETAIDRVAALGAAALAVTVGADRHDVAIGACQDVAFSQENALAGELASLLWHIRYGAQFDALPTAIVLFATWLSGRGKYAKLEPERRMVLMPKLATRAMHEWLSDRCVACGGSGKEERTRSGSWVKPKGSMQRNAVFRVCRVCHGSKRRIHGDRERATSLGLSKLEYESGRWDACVRGSVAALDNVFSKRLYSPLTAELERRKRRS